MFSEADVPKRDVLLGIAVHGAQVELVRQHANADNINVALGIFEVEEHRLFDTALFIYRAGRIALKYRGRDGMLTVDL